MKVSTTIGFERRHNQLLGREDEDASSMSCDRGPRAAAAELPRVVELNRGPLLTAGVEVMPLAPRQVELKRRRER